jgi:hypothetical protein
LVRWRPPSFRGRRKAKITEILYGENRMSIGIVQDDSNLDPVGAELNNAIWEAAWFAVNKRHCDKDTFVTLVTKAADEAFDSQVNNAAVRAQSTETFKHLK